MSCCMGGWLMRFEGLNSRWGNLNLTLPSMRRQVTGKFSVRIVPDQTPEGVEATVVKHCNKVKGEK